MFFVIWKMNFWVWLYQSCIVNDSRIILLKLISSQGMCYFLGMKMLIVIVVMKVVVYMMSILMNVLCGVSVGFVMLLLLCICFW